MDRQSCFPSERSYLSRISILLDELYHDMRQERDGTVVAS